MITIKLLLARYLTSCEYEEVEKQEDEQWTPPKQAEYDKVTRNMDVCKDMKGLDKERPPDDVENFQVKEVMMVMKWNT